MLCCCRLIVLAILLVVHCFHGALLDDGSKINHVTAFTLLDQIIFRSTRSLLVHHKKEKCIGGSTSTCSRLQMRSSASMASISSTSSTKIDTTWTLPKNVKIETMIVNKDNERDIMNIATLRNNCTSPLEMIQNQQTKKDSINKVKSMINGFSIGCGIGTCIGFGTYVTSYDIMDSIQKGGIVSIVLGGVLGFNNAMGNRIYVMTEPEAINRLKVDYVASLLTGQDIGFVAFLSGAVAEDSVSFTRYKTCNNFVGCVDCDIRSLAANNNGDDNKNEDSSGTSSSRQTLHIKNMYVDPFMRRKGVAKELLQEVEQYAKKQQNIQYLTLDVDTKNVGAVRLYESNGFQHIENPSKEIGYDSKSFIFGRQLLAKQII